MYCRSLNTKQGRHLDQKVDDAASPSPHSAADWNVTQTARRRIHGKESLATLVRNSRLRDLLGSLVSDCPDRSLSNGTIALLSITFILDKSHCELSAMQSLSLDYLFQRTSADLSERVISFVVIVRIVRGRSVVLANSHEVAKHTVHRPEYL